MINERALWVEDKITSLTEAARIVLWHLAAGGQLSGPALAERLREARRQEAVDPVLTELKQAGLITSDYAGLQFVIPPLLSTIRQITRDEAK